MKKEELQSELEGEVQAGTITRDSKGRYVPGNSGGPGRPKKLTFEIFWETVKKHATPESLDELIQATFEAAKCGDAKARDAIVRLLSAKEGSLREFELSERTREQEEAQERIDAKYNLSDGKKKGSFDFEIAEAEYEIG
jgi:hypothetical protein